MFVFLFVFVWGLMEEVSSCSFQTHGVILLIAELQYTEQQYASIPYIIGALFGFEPTVCPTERRLIL